MAEPEAVDYKPPHLLQERKAAGRIGIYAMADDDDLKHSFYLRALRTAISNGLRNQYKVTDALPDKLLELLLQMEQETEGDLAEETPPPQCRTPPPQCR